MSGAGRGLLGGGYYIPCTDTHNMYLLLWPGNSLSEKIIPQVSNAHAQGQL